MTCTCKRRVDGRFLLIRTDCPEHGLAALGVPDPDPPRPHLTLVRDAAEDTPGD